MIALTGGFALYGIAHTAHNLSRSMASDMIFIGKTTPELEAALARRAAVVDERRPPTGEESSALDTWEDEGGRIAPSAMRFSRD